jgi:hypothetical protein
MTESPSGTRAGVAAPILLDSHVDERNIGGLAFGSLSFPQQHKCTWQLVEFWDAELRRGSAPRSDELMHALVLDTCVGSLPLSWLQQRWPTAYEAVLNIVYDSAASLQQKYGYTMAASVLYKFRAERSAHASTSRPEATEDMQIAADVEEMERAVLQRRLLEASAVAKQVATGEVGPMEGALQLKRREPPATFWWDMSSYSPSKKSRSS